MMYSYEDDVTDVVAMKKDFYSAFKCRCGQTIYRYGNSEDLSSSGNCSSLAMPQLLEKEKQRQLEVIEAKAIITKMKNDLTSLQAKYQKTCVEHEQAMSELNQKYDTNRGALITVKEQLEKLLVEDEQLRDRFHKTQALLTQSAAEHEKKLLALQKDKHQLQMDLQQVEQEAHVRQQELRNDNLKKESELRICHLDLDETKEQLHQALKRYNTTFAQLQEAEESRLKGIKAEQRMKELEMKLSQLETEQTVTRTMRDQLDRLKSLESENSRLKNENMYCKETQDNVFLLREENSSLKKQLERVEKKCIDLVMLQTENKELRDELEKWRSINDGNPKRPLSPKELTRRLIDLQQSNTSLLERQGILQASIHSSEERLKRKESKLDVLQSQLTQAQVQAKEAEQLIVRLKRKLLLVSKERDSNKSMLESYEREASADKATTSQRNIKQLQDTLRSYQNHVTGVETELEQKTKELTMAISNVKVLEAEISKLKQSKPPTMGEADSKIISQLREQVVTLEKRLEEIQVENEDMKIRLERAYIQGIYEPEKTKIITMTINPFTMARKRRHEEIEEIAEENKHLKTRLKVIEENQSDLEDITQKVSLKLQESGVDSQQIKEFQEQIRSAELKNQRLMEVFKKKSQELREVVCHLLGYMIQLPCDNQYKLVSIYAESPDDVLVFQKADSGELLLLETEYSTTLIEKMELYLKKSNSIPAFLSSLTMDLYSQQTMLQ